MYSRTNFSGGEEKRYFAQTTRRSRAANPAEVLNLRQRRDPQGSGGVVPKHRIAAATGLESISRFADSPAKNNWREMGALESVRYKMRSDMHKVVVERERHGSTRKNRKWGKRFQLVENHDYDDQPKFVSSGRIRQYGGQRKWFSDVLGPLKGFLRRSVGRPWDKVYRELRQGLDVRKVTGRHIFDHLQFMVETDCSIGADGRVYDCVGRHRVQGFHVHPKSGLLCFVPRQSARERKKERLLRQDIDEIKLDRCHSYKRIDDLWYWIAYEYVEVERGTMRSCCDVVDRRNVKLTCGRWRIAVSKRQCNSEEVHWIRERLAAWEKQVRRM